MSKIRCVMFDFGNVLGVFNAQILYEFLLKNRENCLEPKEIFCSLVGHVRDFDAGRIDEFNFFIKIQNAFQLNHITVSEFYNAIKKTLEPDYDMLNIVHDLRKKGVATVLITNMNSFSERHIRLSFSDFLAGFDYSMISHVEKVIKPDLEAWIRPLDFMGLKPEECLFVDDWIVNIEAACRLGIKGWHYNVSGNDLGYNGRLEQERLKFKNFLSLAWSEGLLVPNK